MVTVGDTWIEPLGLTEPMPWSIMQDVALVEDQVRVEDAPVTMVAGLAEMLTVGAGCGPTVTVVLAVAEPPAPVAVIL
jgi:hypothetical protein